MPLRRDAYKDFDKFKETRRKQKLRYYRKSQGYEPSNWTLEHDEMVLDHAISDTELSKIIHHSVGAIQQRRCALKKLCKTKGVYL